MRSLLSVSDTLRSFLAAPPNLRHDYESPARLVRPSPLGERQPHRQRAEGGGEAAAQPREHARPIKDMAARRRGEDAVEREDDEGREHEGGGQFAHADERVRFAGADELRQEGDEEDRQLGIEQIDGDRVDDDAQVGASRRRLVDRQRTALVERVPGMNSR